MPNVFISYRRDDSSTISELIDQKLIEHYGPTAVFRDIDNIAVAEDFQKAIGRALRRCDVMVAVIGKRWLGVGSDGVRRIDGDRDWIRREIEIALQLDIPIIPVLVEGGTMPSQQMIPEGMRDLTRLQGLVVEVGPDFDSQVARLTTAIDQIDGGTTGRRIWRLLGFKSDDSTGAIAWRAAAIAALVVGFAILVDAVIGLAGGTETPMCRSGAPFPWCLRDIPARSQETDATRVHAFDFQTPSAEFKPGVRKWTRLTPEVWEQVYPDGTKNYNYRVKRISLNDCDGTVVASKENPDFQAFFPDRSCESKQFMFRRLSQGEKWIYYVPIDHME